MLFRVRGRVNVSGKVSTFNTPVDGATIIAALAVARASLLEQGATDEQITNLRADVMSDAKSLVKLRASEATPATPTTEGAAKPKPKAASRK